ncbi:proclotting enzyme-like [Ornithodoros turicata]|uniref:proclotting enzyme-like n=1 Tax=Ornithodoros turicata TaxID=34597 RepID=UPI003138D213
MSPILILLAGLCLVHGRELHKRQSFEFPDDNDSDCSTPQNEPGSCILLSECPALQSVRDYTSLQRSICGFSQNNALLCCPKVQPEPDPTTPSPVPTRRTRRPTAKKTPQSPRLQPPVANIEEGPRIAGYPGFLPANCGKSNVTGGRIVGGRESVPGSWPWMVAIYIKSGDVNSAACGGALVTSRHIVTAAHCVVAGRRTRNLPPSVFTARLGDHNLVRSDDNAQPVDVQVIGVERHADYEPRTFKNDIAVLTLEKPVTFNKFVRPVCLPFGDDLGSRNLTGYHGFVAGWGDTAFNGDYSDVLREAQIRIWDEPKCKEAFKKEVPISDVYLCAGDGEGRKDACRGDSGGPFVLPNKGRFYLIGVVSFGKRCATVGYPGVYTRVTKFMPWILERIQ